MSTQQLPGDVIYAYIKAYIEQHGYPPTIRNIATACHMGRTTVHYYLEKLEDWGWIEREPGQARSLNLRRDRIAEIDS
jgi:repressor LexA